MRWILLALTVGVGAAYAQPDSLWSRYYGGPRDDYGMSMLLLDDGGFALAGVYERGDYALVRTDSLGNQLWMNLYRDDQFQNLMMIKESHANGFIMVGDGDFIAIVNDRGETLKDTLMNNEFGGFFGVALDNDSGYVIACWTGDLIHVENNLNVDWTVSFDGIAQYVFKSSDGGYVVVGIIGGLGSDLLAIKFDAEGNIEWTNNYGTEFAEVGWTGIETADGGFAFAGFQQDPNDESNGSRDIYLVKTDSEGDMEWDRVIAIDIHNEDICFTLLQREDGGFALAGRSYESGLSKQYSLVRTNSMGELIWYSLYGVGGDEYCTSICQTNDGGYALFGRGYDPANRQNDHEFRLLRLGPDPVNNAIPIDPAKPDDIVLLKPFPNPFNSSVNLSFQLGRREPLMVSLSPAPTI